MCVTILLPLIINDTKHDKFLAVTEEEKNSTRNGTEYIAVGLLHIALYYGLPKNRTTKVRLEWR